MSFINVKKLVEELKVKTNVFALLHENGSRYVFKASCRIVTKGCNTFEGEYGTQYSIGVVLDEFNDLDFLFDATVPIKAVIRGWTRKPTFKGNTNETLFLKLKSYDGTLAQDQQVQVSANVGIYFNTSTKTFGLYFSNVIVV